MTLDELLNLKKEVDELNLHYLSLKNKKEELLEKVYANNQEDDNKFMTEDKYLEPKVNAFFLRLILILSFKNLINFSTNAFIIINLINILYFAYKCLFGYDKYFNKNNKEDDSLDDLLELQDIEDQLEILREQCYEKSIEYNQELTKLDKEAYQEYIDYVSEYIISLLEHKEIIDDTHNYVDKKIKKILR